MSADFQSSGKTPDSYDFLNIAVDTGPITFSIAFSMWGLIFILFY